MTGTPYWLAKCQNRPKKERSRVIASSSYSSSSLVRRDAVQRRCCRCRMIAHAALIDSTCAIRWAYLSFSRPIDSWFLTVVRFCTRIGANVNCAKGFLGPVTPVRMCTYAYLDENVVERDIRWHRFIIHINRGRANDSMYAQAGDATAIVCCHDCNSVGGDPFKSTARK